ncbi:MAG: PepSY domain-containing protein [Robiginitomaculum sp.]
MRLKLRHIARIIAPLGVAIAVLASANAASAQPRDMRDSKASARFTVPAQNFAPARISQFAPMDLPRDMLGVQFAAKLISASQAKSIALRHVPGSEFLDIKLVGGNTYIVRVIKNGRRIDVRIDAATGRVK